METIVTGVDGSSGANVALRFAIAEAALRRARLRVVCAWEVPVFAYTGEVPPPNKELDRFRLHAEAIVAEAVANVRRDAPAVECEGVALEGQPARVLLEQAATAVMAVVGKRGRGGFAGLLLGSLSHQLVHHAPCPVVVVPERPSL